MNAVERVKEILKERRIPVSRMEKDLGFSNGYLASLKRGKIEGERLAIIAKYLDVSTDYLLYGTEPEEHDTIETRNEMRDNFAYRILFDVAQDATESELLEAAAHLKRRKEERESK